ncbi:hypothetical protein [Streptomyces massasporeus]|uniref:hypothetical protein n=1 Tax=Streptomyces massasporeus TaxID=67324 RepID=UPI003406C649
MATADYRAFTTGGIGALRADAVRGAEALREDPALGGDVSVRTGLRTGLPDVLDRAARTLLVARLLDGERAGDGGGPHPGVARRREQTPDRLRTCDGARPFVRSGTRGRRRQCSARLCAGRL